MTSGVTRDRRVVAVLSILLFAALLVIAGLLVSNDDDAGVQVEDEFTATITAINERSICVDESERGDDEGSCGIPVFLDRDAEPPVEVGDRARITTMWLVDRTGARYEAWYVRRP